MLVAALTLVASLSSPPAWSQSSDEGDVGVVSSEGRTWSDDENLPFGYWMGSARASGVTTTDHDGMHFRFWADYQVEFDFDAALGGELVGTWDLIGPGEMLISAPDANIYTEYSFSGSGDLSGDGPFVDLMGEIDYAGQSSVFGEGRSFTSDFEDTTPFETSFRVARAGCGEATGDWILVFNEMLADMGWTPTFSGGWIAFRLESDFGPGTREAKEELLPRIVELADDLNAMLDESDSWGDTIPADEIWEILNAANTLINELRNLSLCDVAALGDQVQDWVSLSEDYVAWFMNKYLDQYKPSATGIKLLVDIGLNVGTFASHPELLTQLQEEAAQVLLANRVDGWSSDGEPCPTSGCLDRTEDVRTVLVLARQLAWTHSPFQGVPVVDGSS